MQDWTRRTLGEFCSEIEDRCGSRRLPVFSVSKTQGIILQSSRFKKRIASANLSRYKVLRPGDFAFDPMLLWSGSIARNESKVVGVISPAYCVFRVAHDVRPRFLYYFLSQPERLPFYNAISFGTNERRRKAQFRDFAKLMVPVPEDADQERIEGLLADAETLTKLRHKADALTAASVPALFHSMFGDPAEKKSRWPTVRLDSTGTVVTGNTPPRKDSSFFGNHIEWVKTDNIDSRACKVTRAAEGLSKQGANRGRVVPAGAILVTCIAGSIGRLGDAAIVDREVAINQQINAIIPSADFRPAFLCAQIHALRQQIRRRSTGVMTRMISKSVLGGIPAIRAPLEAQVEFELRASELRVLQVDQSEAERRMKRLFSSVQHRAFSGRLK